MSLHKFLILELLFVVGLLINPDAVIVAQTPQPTDSVHEITIYAMPTLMPLDWSSPSTLYKSMKTCYFKTITVADNYLLGHVAVRINSSLLSKPLLIAMTSAKPEEKADMVLNKKLGLGIFGATMHGRIETEKELNRKLAVYAKRNKLAFITFRVNEQAAKRMLEFIEKFSQKNERQYVPSDYYGGAFWPRYEGEGSGCSAFGLALLDVAGIMPAESEYWLKKVNIPMELVGGMFNSDKKIKNRSITKADHWHSGKGVANVDYVYHQIYEPSIMFDWILEKRMQNDEKFKSVETDGVPGVCVDSRQIPAPVDKPIFEQRKDTDVFIKQFFVDRNKLVIPN